jgi:hypothetical protein
MAYAVMWSADEMTSAYGLSAQGEVLVVTLGAGGTATNTYSSYLAKDKVTPVLAPGTSLTNLKTESRKVIKNQP